MSPTNTDPRANIYSHDFDCLYAIDQIMLHPQLSELEAQALIAGIEITTGFKGEVVQSKLYRLPKNFKAIVRTH